MGTLKGHCGHAPKCMGVDPLDERDPLGCCNCGTREAERKDAQRRALATGREAKEKK